MMPWEPAGKEKKTFRKNGVFLLWSAAEDSRELLDGSSLGNFLQNAGIPVSTQGSEPPHSKDWLGVYEPKKSAVKLFLALFFAMLVIPLATLVGLVMKLFRVPPGGEGGVGIDTIIHGSIFLSFTLPFFLIFLGLLWNTERRGAKVSLFPAPKNAVNRAFIRRSVLYLDGAGNLVLQNAENKKRRMRSPSDSGSGVTDFWILKHQGKPWCVLLVDCNGTIQAELPWISWFSGDPALVGLRKFANELGVFISVKECKPLPGQDEDLLASRRTHSYWISESSSISLFNFFIPSIWVLLYLAFPPTGTHLQWLAFAGIIVAALMMLFRITYQLFWLRGMVTVPPVSEVEYRWERKQREREPEVDHG
ncbi:hypothetical protein FNQ90_03065 [Streptomyces alkaliphilus]|uniref:Uncharacterized protein n=1 Tax=Streptomyces alkaliphilus TaxID=1472722 RepID=A0A7W3Y0B2_9ACTN|nr:hypothetical protein [Streptomyces alkaliphilus]